MPILVAGLSHHTAPVNVRERFAFSEAELPAELARLTQGGMFEEAVILSTCNRVEVYAYTTDDGAGAPRALKEFLLESRKISDPIDQQIYALREPESLQHLFKVACGMDSMVLGETEILGQLKKAYDLALQHKFTGGKLNKAFQRAFNVAKQIRTETNIQRGTVSVASAAVELAEKIFENLGDREIMVLGAGDTSEKTARALLSRGAKSIIVSNRSYERAEALAADLGGRAVRFDDWAAEFERIDIIISSTAAPHYVIDRAKLTPLMKLRKNRPLLLIDIAVPRDIEPEVNFLENVYLYNIDDLQAIADDGLRQRQEQLSRCMAIIHEKIAALLAPIPPHSAIQPLPSQSHA